MFEKLFLYAPAEVVEGKLNRHHIAERYYVFVRGKWLKVRSVDDDSFITSDGRQTRFDQIDEDFLVKEPSNLNLQLVGVSFGLVSLLVSVLVAIFK